MVVAKLNTARAVHMHRPKATNIVAASIADTPPSAVRVLTLRRPKPADLHPGEAINTTSKSAELWSRGLSPFNLGPVVLYGGHIAQNMESCWQYSKMYPVHADAHGEPTARYWEWAQAGWADPVPRRFPMGRGAVPLCSLWEGRRLGYIEARHVI